MTESEEFDFDKHSEGTKCRVMCADEYVRIAYAYKYHPFSSEPNIFFTDWITNSPSCMDDKNGRLQDTFGQEVLAWEVVE